MRLSHLLIAKSISETIFIAALAAGYYLRTTPPVYHGWSEVTAQGVAGWVVSRADSSRIIEVQMYVNGEFFASTVASAARPDVVAAGRAESEHCGFVFHTSSLGEGVHEARIFAVHKLDGAASPRTLIPFGPTLHFMVNENKEIVERDGRRK